MSEKRFILIIASLIFISIITSVIIGVSVYKKDKVYVLDVEGEYTEENALKAKSIYDTKEMKQEFLDLAQDISSVVYAKILDGTVTDEGGLKKSISEINDTLSSDNWSTLGLVKPQKWLGTWYLDNLGFLKFKFVTKTVEPNWVTSSDVSDYVVLN